MKTNAKPKPKTKIDEGVSPEGAPLDKQPVVVDDTELADALLSDAPEPRPEAMKAVRDAVEADTSRTASATDRYGRRFDPAIHERDAAGAPVLTRSGNLRIRPGAGKQRSRSHLRTSSPADAAAEGPRPEHWQVASVAVDTGVTLLENVFGPAWRPVTDAETGRDERAELVAAAAVYCRAKDVRDFPPGAALALTVSAYALARAGDRRTRATLRRWFGGLWSRVTGFLRRRRSRAFVAPGSQAPVEPHDESSPASQRPSHSPAATASATGSPAHGEG